MGYYIDKNSKGEPLPSCGKADALIKDGALEIPMPSPDKFVEGLVCVVENAYFDAAGYCYSPSELIAFQNPGDYRPKRWLWYKHAKTLSGYEG
jgi:hypothetical protein